MATLLGFDAKAMTGFAAAPVLESELPGPVNAADWPQAASVAIAAIAANPKAQRDRREARTVRERSRSQWVPTDAYTFNVDVGARRRLRPMEIIIASPSLAFALPTDITCLQAVITSARVIVIRFCNFANMSPSAHVADLRQA